MKELQIPYDTSFSVQLWDISKSKCRTLHTVRRKENRPMCVCFSSDGKLLYCGYCNGRIIQWDVISGIALALLFPNGLVVKRESEDLFTEEFEALDNTIISIDYSPDGHFLAACCKEGVVIWDVTALELLIVQQTEDEARFINCSFSCDSQHLAASTNKGTLKVWAISNFTFSLEVSTNPDGSLNPLSECCFDNQKNVLCVFQNTARIYAYSTLVQTTHTHINYEAVHPNRANSSLFLPDEKYAVTCGGKSLCLWDVSSCHLVASAYGIVGGYLIRVSADGKTLLTYGDRCYIEVWDVKGLTKTHTLVHQEQANVPIPFYDPDDSSPTDICHCAISVNSIVVGGTGQGNLFVWYGNRLEFVKELKFHESLISFVEFSPNGNAFVSADTDGVIMMWKIQSQNESDFEVNMIPLHAHNDSIEQVFYSPQGRRIASCSMDKSVHLYNGSNGDLIERLIGHSSGIMRLGFSCDGCHLVSGDEKGCIIVWDGVTGHQQLRIQPHLDKIIFDVCFVSGNKYICSRDVHAGYITVNEVTSGKEVASLSFSTDIFTMSGSTSWKDSSYILCGLKDGSIKFVKLRDTETDSLDILG